MNLLKDINYESIEAAQPGDGPKPVQPGVYHAMIANAESKPTKNGRGMMLVLTWQILDEGPAKGRNVVTRLNLQNQSQTAVDIARAELKALTDALGVYPEEESQLLNRVCKLELITKKRDDDPTKMANEIKKYLKSTAPANPKLEESVKQNASTSPDEETPF